MKTRAITAIAAVLLVTGCVEDTGPDADACAAPALEIELDLSAGTLDPNDPAVCRDQEVMLVITPSVDGVFHIHGYDAEVPATQVTNGEPIELRFVATRSGQFPIEMHPLDDPTGVEIGVFTVHEP